MRARSKAIETALWNRWELHHKRIIVRYLKKLHPVD